MWLLCSEREQRSFSAHYCLGFKPLRDFHLMLAMIRDTTYMAWSAFKPDGPSSCFTRSGMIPFDDDALMEDSQSIGKTKKRELGRIITRQWCMFWRRLWLGQGWGRGPCLYIPFHGNMYAWMNGLNVICKRPVWWDCTLINFHVKCMPALQCNDLVECLTMSEVTVSLHCIALLVCKLVGVN